LTRALPSQIRTRGGRSGKRARVLVIDDVPEVRELYCTYLEYNGFVTDAAEDGLAGLAKVVALQPDVVVLDYSMPRMDGEQVLARLQEDPRTRRIPVVMMTAVPELVGTRALARCAAFVEKPCDPDRLVSAILGVLERQAATAR
jgi:CheY-like chemotaxis protein